MRFIAEEFIFIAILLHRCRQAETGEQLGYVEFQDVASATKAIQQLQGHMGLGGKGLRLAPSTSTLSQLTGTPAAGTGAQKRPREESKRIFCTVS